MASRSYRKNSFGSQDYKQKKFLFKGLNYLLQEQPDKAIDTFIDLVEVDSDTVETHLALGSLFRKRGEVERAIRIHQNIIARPNLETEQRESAIYELALDYYKTGLFDRAEVLLTELSEQKYYSRLALKRLQVIYQTTKEWDKAVIISERLISIGDSESEELIGNYICENVENEVSEKRFSVAKKILKRYKNFLSNSVRAKILWGKIDFSSGNYKQAYKSLIESTQINLEYFPEVVGMLKELSTTIGYEKQFKNLLMDMVEKYEGITPSLYLLDFIEREDGRSAAAEFLFMQLQKYPSIKGLQRLLSFFDVLSDDRRSSVKILIDGLADKKVMYRCKKCGFEAKKNFWKCPGCDSWETIKPVI